MSKELHQETVRDDQQEFQYYAFISYSHKDMKWARWLQRKLETYKLPSKLQENKSEKKDKKPRQHLIQPVFRDETSINPGKSVDDALKSELEKSKFLIVICSPALSVSTWCNREVERFVEMGREDRIMPFIVEGVPHSQDPAKECYCPALRAFEERKGSSILGADVQARGKREAFLCTVAFLLGIELETLRSRETERRRNKYAAIIAVSMVFAALCTLAGIKAWDYYVPKISYYQDYTMRFGLPEGIGELTKEQIKSREEHFEITRQYGRIQNIAHKNQYGTITDLGDAERLDYPASMDFNYDDDGNLISCTQYRENGAPVMTWKYTDHLRVVQFEYPERNVNAESGEYGSDSLRIVAMTLSADTQSMEASLYERNTKRSFIAGYIIDYYDNGLIRNKYYSDMPAFGRKTKDANGVWGLRYEYDSEGRVTRILNLGENKEILMSRKGYAQRVYSYDQNGQWARVEYQDEFGKPVKNEQGWAIDIQRHENGNLVEEESRDAEGNPIINNDGWARITLAYDQMGNCIESCLYGINGEPIADSSRWHKVVFTYDELGRETERKGYDPEGNLALCADGYVSSRSLYDEKGNFTEMICYDKDGNIVTCYDGYASWKAVYNDRGEIIERRFFDEKGNAALFNQEYATIKWVYDDYGNVIEYSYFGKNDEPILNMDGVATEKDQYDERGNRTEEAFYDIHGQPSNCYYGFAKITYGYDKQGNVTDTAYYGKDGEPVLIGRGYASERHQYDDKGNMTETSYYGTAGQLKTVIGGYAGWASKYDDFGNETEVCYFDTNKNPVACNDGYAVKQIKYDALNNPIEVIYLDINRNQISVKEDADNKEGQENPQQQTDQGMVEYQVAFANARISLPADWVYADRSITDDSEFCVAWDMTSKEFVNEFLMYDHYAFAVDSVSSMFFDVIESTLNDYSKTSKVILERQSDNLTEWIKGMGEQIVSSEIAELRRPYCKVRSKGEGSVYFYYETVKGKKTFLFIFIIDADKWDPAYEKVYDEIVKESALNDIDVTEMK